MPPPHCPPSLANELHIDASREDGNSNKKVRQNESIDTRKKKPKKEKQKGAKGKIDLKPKKTTIKEWVQVIDEESGNPYWYDRATQTTRWDNPMDGHHRGATNTSLEDGWTRAHTGSGEQYYVEKGTGETSWEKPGGKK